MNQIVLSQIEKSIFELPANEQLLLIARVAEKLRRQINVEADFEFDPTEMANDENIQRESKNLPEKFQKKI